jgi:hypothetical protein
MSGGLTISSLCSTIVKRYGLRAGISLAAFVGTGAVVMLGGTMAPITGLKPTGAAMFKGKDGIVRSCQAVFCCARLNVAPTGNATGHSSVSLQFGHHNTRSAAGCRGKRGCESY